MAGDWHSWDSNLVLGFLPWALGLRLKSWWQLEVGGVDICHLGGAGAELALQGREMPLFHLQIPNPPACFGI